MAFGFEPKFSKNELRRMEEENQAVNISSERMHSLNWCKCSGCVLMPTEKECVCCWENQNISVIRCENSCITTHDSFEQIILNLDSLNIVRHNLILQCKSNAEKEKYRTISNKLWRHMAYKNFVFWINSWTTIGRHNRIVIPACVVRQVRENFPEENNDYTGFIEHEFN